MIFKIGKSEYIGNGVTTVKETSTKEKLTLTETEDNDILTDQYGRSWKLIGIWTLELVTA